MISGFWLALLLAPSPQSGAPLVQRVAPPTRWAHLDLASGTLTRGAQASTRSAATVTDLANLDLAGFVGVDTGAGGCEWINAATKGYHGNASDLMSEIVLVYCSSALDPLSGGPGGSARLGFYEGYSSGGATPSTTVAVLNLSGLPANTAASSFFGGFRCTFLSVEFADLVAFADGPIGYSWRFEDVGTTGVLAATFPFLSCVQSCSGIGPDGQGMVDHIDQYCPPGTLLPPISFPTLYGTFESIAIDIREAADAPATVAPFTGDGINADVLLAPAIQVTQPWDVTLALGHPHGAGGVLSLRVRTQTTNGSNVTSPIGGRLTEVLISGPLLAAVAGTHDGSTGGFPTVEVPGSLALVCQEWAAQATVLGGGFGDLSRALIGTVGTP
jgi:hypothetical protein